MKALKPSLAVVAALVLFACTGDARSSGPGDDPGGPDSHDDTGAGGGSGMQPDGGDDDSMPPDEPMTFYLMAWANHRVVSAGAEGASPLVADHTSAGDGEAFEVVENDDGTISLRSTANGLYVTVDVNDEDELVATSEAVSTAAKFRKIPEENGGVALQSVVNDLYVSADLNEGAVLYANRMMVAEWETFYLRPITSGSGETPDFGPNVFLFDPSMPAEAIQAQVDAVFGEMQTNEFGASRYAFLFQPGSYDVDVNVGYYTHVVGLGASPDDVTINGAVHSEDSPMWGNALVNFWRAAENFSVVPAGGTNRWAVSQAAPFRRVHVKGNLDLWGGGYSSGGLLADSVVDGLVRSGSQQQWLTRNTRIGSWDGANWNMVFVGVTNAPEGSDDYPDPPFTVVDETPVIREKPFLVFDDALGAYSVFVPALRSNVSGASWEDGAAGTSIPIAQFYVAREGVDSAETINAALAEGKHLLVTPGIYHLSEPIQITRADTVILGLGLATFVPDDGVVAMTVADVDGVKVAGLLFDAGEVSSPVLMQVGPPGSSADHAQNPTSLHDVFFRVGGSGPGKAEVSLEINSDDVIGDHFWIWRADHGDGVAWDGNTAANGLVVHGDDVTIYGLFVEHYQGYQATWDGEGGRTYFFQNEIPYDVPDQGRWMNGDVRGFAAYKVAEGVTSHEVWGLGSYCYFSTNPSVVLERSFEVPDAPGVKLHHMVTVSLGGNGTIAHIVNATGDAANGGHTVSRLPEYP